MYAPFVFGIYPGGESGSESGLLQGPPDDPAQIERCLNDLQGTAPTFIVRVYERFSDRDHPSRWPDRTPRSYEQYAEKGRLLDMVIMFQSLRGDVAGYLDFAAELVRRHASRLYSVQITEEASFANGPDCIDGGYPNVLDALVAGVSRVKRTLREIGRPEVLVGFNSTPTFGESSKFWTRIGELAGEDFHRDLDYAGLDFFPDVFRRAAPDGQPGDVVGGARMVLETMRNEWLAAARIRAHIPIHIAEHGWPTGPERTEERQAEVIEKVLRLIWSERERLNLARYTLFSLRDTDSTMPGSENDMFRFGITRSDYSPKPAYAMLRSVIREFNLT